MRGHGGGGTFRVEGEVINLDVDELIRNEIPNREAAANWLSKITFWYLNGIVLLGWQRSLQQNDIDAPHPNLRAKPAFQDFDRFWALEKQRPQPSLFKALYHSAGRRWWVGMVAFALYIALSFLPPLMLNIIVGYLEGSRDLNTFQRYGIAVAVFVVPLLASVCYNFHNQLTAHVGFRARAAVSHAIYRKSLVLSNVARAKSTAGHIVNIMSTDAQQIQAVTASLNMAWSSPVQIAIALWLLYEQVGVAMLVGVGIMVLLVPVNKMVFGTIMKYRFHMLRLADKRVKIINELLLSIRVVKMYAWEAALKERVMTVREQELTFLKKIFYIIAVGFMLVLVAAPLIMPVLVFITYTKMGNVLTASTAFTTLALFGIIRGPFAFLPMVIQQIANSRVSLDRIRAFLLCEEMKPGLITAPEDSDDSVHLKGLTATWGAPKPSADALSTTTGPTGHGHGHGHGHGGGSRGGHGHSRGGGGGSSRRGKKELADQASGTASIAPMARGDSTTAKWTRTSTAGRGAGHRGPVLDLAVIDEREGGTKGTAANPAAPTGASTSTDAAGESAEEVQAFRLQDIELRVPTGQLVAVVGPIGSGKSTLLSAMLGELKVLQGSVHMRGKIAYAAQQPWILNTSLRDNIRFDVGAPLSEERYTALLHACALQADLAQFKDGDRTEIGERGINLSGGQKARVAVARAVYNDAEVYLLDDILSAVDQHVAEHMFREVILRLLTGKTRVLVTNQLQFLSQCDHVVVMEQGKIAQQGSFAQLMASGLDFAKMVTKHGLNHTEEAASQPTVQANSANDSMSATPKPVQSPDASVTSSADVIGAHGNPEDTKVSGVVAAPSPSISAETLAHSETPSITSSLAVVAPSSVALVVNGANSALLNVDASPSATEGQLQHSNGTKTERTVVSTVPAASKNGVNGHASSSEPNKPTASAKAGKAEGLIVAEERAEGEVPWSTYLYYFRSAGRVFVWVLVGFIGTEAFRLALDFWLANWSGRSGNRTGEDTDYYIGIYGAFGAAVVFCVFVRSLAFAQGRIRVSRVVMENAFNRVLRAPMRFFDTTPVGRILNRFSRDLDSIDQLMGQAVMQTLSNSFQVFSTAVAISIASKGVLLLALGGIL